MSVTKHLQFDVKKGHISRIYALGEPIIQFIPFVYAFYAFESPLFYSHCNHESDVVAIPPTCHEHKNNRNYKIFTQNENKSKPNFKF
jgi:hypothetical protein